MKERKRDKERELYTLQSGLHQIEWMEAERGDHPCRETRYGLHKGWRQAILARHEPCNLEGLRVTY